MWDPNAPWQAGDEREDRRVELVGLAAEVATVAGRVTEELAGRQASEQVQALRAECERLLAAAMGILSPAAQIDTSAPALAEALAAFREHQGACLLLREQADVLASGIHIPL